MQKFKFFPDWGEMGCDVNSTLRKVGAPSQRREMATAADERYGINVQFARICLYLSVTPDYYNPTLSAENQCIADGLLRLTTANERCGCSVFLAPL